MKKTILLTYVFASAIAFVACKKSEKKDELTQTSNTIEAANTYNTSITDNHLTFKTIQDYRNLVDLSTPESKTKFISQVNNMNGFHSYCKVQDSKKTIKDDLFRAILSEDMTVQIGENIFKINPTTEKVYSISANFSSEYTDLLNENTKNNHIQSYSFEDDVLGIIEGSANKTLWCKESGCSGGDATMSDVSGLSVRVNGQVHYNRYGLYFSLFAEAAAAQSGFATLNIQIEPLYYHVKCGSTRGPDNFTYNGGNMFDYQKYQSYQGSTPLNAVYLRARVQAIINNQVFYSDWAEVRRNY